MHVCAQPCSEGLDNITPIAVTPTKLWMLTGWVHRCVNLHQQSRMWIAGGLDISAVLHRYVTISLESLYHSDKRKTRIRQKSKH